MKRELTLRDGTKVNFNLVQYCNKDGTAVINFGENDFFGKTYAQVYGYLGPEVING